MSSYREYLTLGLNEDRKEGKQIYNCTLDNRDGSCVYCIVNEQPADYICWIDALIAAEEE